VRTGVFFTALGMAAAAAWAGEVWKEKPPAEWTEKDVRRILEDSPWAKAITVRAEWTLPGREGYEAGHRVQLESVWADQGGGPVSGTHRDAAVPVARFILRWASSRTVRAALLREAFLRGVRNSWEAAQEPGRPWEEIEMVLLADPTVRFPRASAAELQANTYLLPRSAGQRIPVSRLEIRRRADGAIAAVAFFSAGRHQTLGPGWTTNSKSIFLAGSAV